MLRYLKKNNAFASIIEVVITSIIFVIASFGIFATITALRPQAEQSSTKLQAIYIGKQVTDELRAQVDAEIWNTTSLLTPKTYNQTIEPYNVSYTVSDVSGLKARQVTMTIDYPE
ncbi:MAG TPA: hypothetical protein PLH56_01390 [Candidatus Omnitrophota bacterium]|nr:hypothetical protein [Candidatus Omnitrophota bacterium]